MTRTPEGRVSEALKHAVINAGGEIRKVQWQNCLGAPDWLVMLKGSSVFVETKAPGEVPRRSQLAEFSRIQRAGGIPVLVLDNYADAERIVGALHAFYIGDLASYMRICAEFSFYRYAGGET